MADATHDVIVIGAGIAGLVAANRAAQLGKRVVVLEKSTEDKYLCNSRYAYGTFHITYSDLEADEASLVARIEAMTEGSARPDLARAIARDARRLMDWLKIEGVDVVRLDGYQTNVLAPAWRKGYGLTWQGYGSDLALQKLGANFAQRQGRILRGHRATALKADDAGFTVETSQGPLRATAVVIADGGFQANLDMVRAFGISPAPEKLLARNGGTAVGDGIRLAQSLGAAITEGGMNNIYGHLHSRDAMNTTKLWPRPYNDELAASGIVVDSSGRRFADEGFGGVWLTNAIARLPDPLGTTIIFDQAIWDGPPGRNHVQPPNPLLPEAGGTLHRAGTIAELAGLIGIAPQRWSGRSPTTTPPSTPARCHRCRRRAAPTATSRGRSGRRRSMPCRSASRSPTPWAASWWTAMPACSTRPTSRSLACSPQAPPSAASTADRTPATSAA